MTRVSVVLPHPSGASGEGIITVIFAMALDPKVLIDSLTRGTDALVVSGLSVASRRLYLG